jgi:hypothetical protein
LRVSARDLHERTDSRDSLEALRRDSEEVLERRIELPNGPGRKSGTWGGSPWYRRISKRVGLLVLLVLAVGAVLSLLKIPSRENLELMETAGCRQGPD